MLGFAGPSASLLDPSKPSQVSQLGTYYNDFISPIAYQRGVVTSASLQGSPTTADAPSSANSTTEAPSSANSTTEAPSSANSTVGAAGEGGQPDAWKVVAASMAKERPWDALCGECSEALGQGKGGLGITWQAAGTSCSVWCA